MLSAFQAQQSAAAAAAAQPQLLIPLSSIPSYSAAMDTNPLLGSTYKKFPYPSMAEISSLAAQTQFTEEQIKVKGKKRKEKCEDFLCQFVDVAEILHHNIMIDQYGFTGLITISDSYLFNVANTYVMLSVNINI